jgi:beta-aspartyl-peptidase (threonine type)
MKAHYLFSILTILISCNSPSSPIPRESEPTESSQTEYALVIHGGAGTILKKNMTAELEQAYTAKMNEALDLGEDILKQGGTSQAAVVAVIQLMENSPLFNAGRGAVFTNQGTNEMDASIMDGKTLNAGAVGGVTNIKNPITAALAVMEHSDHVFMVGKGAEEFAKLQSCQTVDPSYFRTERRWNSLQRIKEKEAIEAKKNLTELSESKHGTVGAVALDKAGNITAGTSTGGMTNKRYNRVGDSPIIGAGTYADNETCGVSCTGHGEYFIRYAVAYDVSAAMRHGGKDLKSASQDVIHGRMKHAGGTGGLIALDKKGNISMPFNTAGMYRGYVTDNERVVKIYGD